MLYSIWLILQAIFNGGFGKEIFIYLGFKMSYTDFQSSVKRLIQNLSISMKTSHLKTIFLIFLLD